MIDKTIDDPTNFTIFLNLLKNLCFQSEFVRKKIAEESGISKIESPTISTFDLLRAACAGFDSGAHHDLEIIFVFGAKNIRITIPENVFEEASEKLKEKQES